MQSFAQNSFDEKVTNLSNVRLSVTNVGTFGNAFRGYRDGSSRESCEYPAGSGVEHLFESGIWIGAQRDGRTLVSTAAVDATQGYVTGGSGFEFTAELGSSIKEESSFRDSRFYSPQAVSHQDYISVFSDKNTELPGTQTQIVNHLQPLFVEIEMKTYNFDFSFSDYVVFVDLELRNIGNPNTPNTENLLDSFYFGLWANTVVRNINVTPPGSGGAAFYNKGGNGYVDSLQLAFCYDHSGDVGFTNSYVGQKFLGASDKFGFHHPSLDTTFESNYNVWTFNNPGAGHDINQAPLGDQEMYKRLTRGVEDFPCWLQEIDNECGGGGAYPVQLNQAGNRSDLVSVGPFRDFRKGDKISIAYAFIMSPKLDDGQAYTDNTPEQMAEFIKNARDAQTTFLGEDKNFNGVLDEGEDKDDDGKIRRFILPAPPDRPKTKVISKDNSVDIFWSNNSEFSIDPITQQMDFSGYKVYLSKFGFDISGVPDLLENLVPIAEFDKVGDGFAKEIGLQAIKLNKAIIFDDDNNPIELENIVYGIDTMLVIDTNTVIDTLMGDTTTIMDTSYIRNVRLGPDTNVFFYSDPTIYYYKYQINNLLNGWQYAVALSAFDTGNREQQLDPLESSLLSNNFRVFPGKQANVDMDKNEPFAYPNPYYLGASWEGVSNFQEESRKIVFANLPKRCVIRIFTPAGDLIDEIEHNENYNGSDIRWYETFGAEDAEDNRFSGGEHAWDLLSSFTQIISRGVYVFAVEDLDSGETKQGKFTILK